MIMSKPFHNCVNIEKSGKLLRGFKDFYALTRYITYVIILHIIEKINSNDKI